MDEQTGRLCMLWAYKANYSQLKAPMIFKRANP